MPTEYEYEQECQEIDEEFKEREENALKGGNTNRMENNKLQSGEEFLQVIILGNIKLPLFKNKNKTDPKQPDYTGNGICAYIQKKK